MDLAGKYPINWMGAIFRLWTVSQIYCGHFMLQMEESKSFKMAQKINIFVFNHEGIRLVRIAYFLNLRMNTSGLTTKCFQYPEKYESVQCENP